MAAIVRRASTLFVISVIGGVALFAARHADAQGNVVMGLDAMIVNNTGGGQPSWGGFGAFNYSNTVGPSATLGRYGAFTISGTSGGSGVGVNFALGSPAIDTPRDSAGFDISPVTANMFPLLDRATFGVNFDPTQYVAELRYKPLPGNLATGLNMSLDTTDAFIDGNNGGAYGNRAGEQWQWGFTDLINKYSNSPKDADGFVTVQSAGNAMTQAASFFHGPSYMYSIGQGAITGNNLPDFNAFGGTPLAAPHGAVQIHLQTRYDATADNNWEVKSVVIRKINPDPREIVRFDSHSGISLRFGAPFMTNGSGITVDGTQYFPNNTDQVSRFDQSGFTPLTLKTTTDSNVGGIALWQPANYVQFDGTHATVDFTAKLTAPQGAGQADHIVLVIKNKSGNDNAGAGSGGDEYHYSLPLSSFNTSTMTTVSVPLTAFTKQQAFEFQNPGNGLLSGFNLYYLGINTDPSVGLVNLAIDHMSVMLPGVTGDYNGNGVVDAADYVLWRKNPSAFGGDPAGYTTWRANFGLTSGAGSAFANAVPEPAAFVLMLAAALSSTVIRRR